MSESDQIQNPGEVGGGEKSGTIAKTRLLSDLEVSREKLAGEEFTG